MEISWRAFWTGLVIVVLTLIVLSYSLMEAAEDVTTTAPKPFVLPPPDYVPQDWIHPMVGECDPRQYI